MADLPQDPIERQKLALLAELHQSLLNYRNALRGWASAHTTGDISVADQLYTFYPDLPRQAAPGKTLADTILEDWIAPKVQEILSRLDPRKIGTPTQAHKLQGVIAYHFTYVKEHLSAAQIVASKLSDAQTICDIWCQITGGKRFAPNKTIEELLIVKSPRTVQRYVEQGMATVFGISFGSARSGKKATTLSRFEESQVSDAPANGVFVSTFNELGLHRLTQSDIVRTLNAIDPSTIDCEQLDRLISAIGNVRSATASVVRFNALAQFAIQLPEAVYSNSRLFNQFIYDLSRYEPDSIEDRVETIDTRERLLNHPVIKRMLAEAERRRLQSTRDVDLESTRHLCRQLTQQKKVGNSSVQETISKLCVVATNWLDDREFTMPLAELFDQLPAAYQVTLVSRLLEDCKSSSFMCAVWLAARASGGYVRSRVRYLARSSQACREHVSSAQTRLAQVTDRIHNDEAADSATRNEILFLEDFVSASGLPPVKHAELESGKHVQAN